MNQSAFFLASIIMMAAGAGFIYLLLRGRRPARPRDAFEWLGVSLSVLLIIVAGFLSYLTLRGGQRQATPMPVAQANTVPDFSGVLRKPAKNFQFRLVSDDRQAALEDYRGKVVLLNIWATWCPPCLEEMPDLNRLQDSYRDRGLVVLNISDEPRTDIQQFTATRPMRTVSGYLVDPTAFPDPYLRGFQARPTTFLIDRKGVIQSYVVGAGTYGSFEDMIKPYL